jgi:hypothetical protein
MRWNSSEPWVSWNKWLEPFYQNKPRIIGEIPLTYDDLEELALACYDVLKTYGMKDGSDRLYFDYPLLMLTLMPCFAAYNTQRDYWQSFADFINIDKTALFNQRWHRCFVELAKARGFKVFTFQDDPTPYVTSIRFQGGIPAYSLPDYFGKMVLPAVQSERLREVTPIKALEYLLGHVYFVDSPVIDFLKNSGQMGEEFFEESCRLARHALQNHGAILSATEVDLPQNVITAFESFLEVEEDKKQHWRKPQLMVTPYSEDAAITLLLPVQEIGLDLFTHKMQWRVQWEGQESVIKIPGKLFRDRQNVVVEEVPLPIQATPRSIIVSFLNVNDDSGEERELRRWNLPLIPAANQTPLLAFDSDGRALPSGQPLPSELVYLITPQESEIEFDGIAKPFGDYSALVGPWKEWKITAWDLSQVWSLLLHENGATLGNVIPVQGVISKPELVDGHLFQFQEYPEQPLYTSDFPSVKIPLASNDTGHTGLAHWHIHVRSLWNAEPPIDKSIKVSDYENDLIMEPDRAKFPLRLLLGDQPAGIYEIKVDGPRDLNGEFRFRVWPKVILLQHSMDLVPPSRSQGNSVFILRLPENAACEVQAGGDDLKIEHLSSGWQITAPPEVNRVLLDLTMSANNGGIVRVPVSIPLPKLRWCLATEKAPGELNWGQTILHQSIDQMLQAGNCSLHLEMYGLSNLMNSLSLRLVDLGENSLGYQDAKFTHTNFNKDWLRVPLGQFKDLITLTNSLAQFELVYSPLQNDSEEMHIPLMEISRELAIDKVQLIPTSETSWKVTWSEEQPLKNRRLMILPAWQPWQAPWEYKIPDNASGEFVIEDISLPPSSYHLYFYIAPTWEDPRKNPPENLNPFIINLCSAEERISGINREGNSPNEHFKNSFELASIYDSLAEFQKRDQIISECATDLIHLTNLGLLISFLKWLQNKNSNFKSFFLNKMFHHQIVEIMLKTYKDNSPILSEYLQYTAKVKMIPSDSAKLMLNLVNDPIAIHSCLMILLTKKDEELALFVVTMMVQARLSKRDALELFSTDPIWAITKIAELESNPYTDSLIAGLLPKLGEINILDQNLSLSEWMIRAIPYEEDVRVVSIYLSYLVSIKAPHSLEILMKYWAEKKIADGRVMELLSISPTWALAVLEQTPKLEEYNYWVKKIIDLFPEAAGIIAPNTILKTPFGKVCIDYIDEKGEGRIKKTRLGDPRSILCVVAGDGKDRIRLQIDFGEMKMNINGENLVWKCERCGFIHPDQSTVIRHNSNLHKYSSPLLNRVPLPIPFETEEIEIVNQ